MCVCGGGYDLCLILECCHYLVEFNMATSSSSAGEI